MKRSTTSRSSLAAVTALAPAVVCAHNVSEQAQQRMLSGGLVDAAWIGAEHMLTGYDHLLFLLGVMLFLVRPAQILLFVTAFTIGHTLTLLFATLAGISADPHLIDAVIALTVVYKAVENLDGFRRWFGIQTPHLVVMVFVFGLIHGFGLSTRLQQMTIAADPRLTAKILAFNVGVELGQVVALAGMFLVLQQWRSDSRFHVYTRSINLALMAAGVLLLALQIHGFMAASA